MKISTRSEYAAKALLYLCMQETPSSPDRPVQISSIAHTCDIPLKYLEQILVVLRNQGLVGSRRGVAGGYYLQRSPQEITVGEVVRLMDGQTSIGASLPGCQGPSSICRTLRTLWDEVDTAIAGTLDKTTFADLCERLQACDEEQNRANMFYI
ncbi:MAG TPA: Rrf2 family transcriptional regulator [Capsulimonadaceae bacterium]|nr:Rrf2 family transcriptional regulator [Capsulimonadaceae bacterium]